MAASHTRSRFLCDRRETVLINVHRMLASEWTFVSTGEPNGQFGFEEAELSVGSRRIANMSLNNLYLKKISARCIIFS